MIMRGYSDPDHSAREEAVGLNPKTGLTASNAYHVFRSLLYYLM